MKTLDELFSEFAAAGAAYAVQLTRHMRASFEVGTAAHRGTGSVAYREAEWAQTDVDNAGHELDRLGRLLVEELLKHLEGEIPVEEYIFRPFQRVSILRAASDGSITVEYWADKERERPSLAVTPGYWLELAVAIPAIQQALKATV